jgi:hypothetical protein
MMFTGFIQSCIQMYSAIHTSFFCEPLDSMFTGFNRSCIPVYSAMYIGVYQCTLVFKLPKAMAVYVGLPDTRDAPHSAARLSILIIDGLWGCFTQYSTS